MKFVDDEKSCVAKHTLDLGSLIAQHRFERFWRDEKYALRMLHETRFACTGNIPVPRVDWNPQLTAKDFKAPELVVDEGFERADVDNQAWILGQVC